MFISSYISDILLLKDRNGTTRNRGPFSFLSGNAVFLNFYYIKYKKLTVSTYFDKVNIFPRGEIAHLKLHKGEARMIHVEEVTFLSPQYPKRFIVGVDNITEISFSGDTTPTVRIVRNINGEEQFTFISGLPFKAEY